MNDATFAAALRSTVALIEDGASWLDAIETTFATRADRVLVRREAEYRYQADGGNLYDGPCDDGAAAYLGEWAGYLEAHVAMCERMAARRAAQVKA